MLELLGSNYPSYTPFLLDTKIQHTLFANLMIATSELFGTVFQDFCIQAKKYQQKTGCPPVLVIDNVNRLALWNPKLLHHLQDIAKDAADDRIFVTVFITSEGLAPIQMLGKLDFFSFFHFVFFQSLHYWLGAHDTEC